MAHPYYSYRLGVGHSVALGSLTNIETITPTGGTRFYPPDCYGSYNPGVAKVRTDGQLYFAGFPSVQWRFRRLTWVQHRYLMTTYCSSGYSGKVTIYTTTDNPNTYARYNAIMVLPKLSDSQKNFTIFADYVITFIKMVAL